MTEKFTEEEMNYYNERITIKLASDVFTYSDKKKVWMVICKKCQVSLMPFETEMDKKTIDISLKKHECKR